MNQAVHDRNPLQTAGLSSGAREQLEGYQQWQLPYLLADLPFAMYQMTATYRTYGSDPEDGVVAFGASMYLAAFRELTKE